MNENKIIDNALAQNFNTLSLLRFAFPSVAMMIFMGIYTIIDTIFIARFVNEYALSSINIVCPIINLTVGLGTMLATGGNAIISRKMGIGKLQEAKEVFTLLTITSLAIGILITVIGLTWLKPIIYSLGASDILYPYCRDYLIILLFFIPANMLQTLFQNLFITAGKPGLGFTISLVAGIANILFDYLFIVIMDMGITGAALGTGIGYILPVIAGICYFTKSNVSLSFTKSKFDYKILLKSCFNGSSEMVSQLATAVTTLFFNRKMMILAGETGVAAITIIIYSQFLLSTLYIGYSMGVAPIIGYNYGSGNTKQQKRIFLICIGFIILTSLSVFSLCILGNKYIIMLFANSSSEVYILAQNGFSIFAYSFLFCGLNIFVCAMFTALSNGKISAILSLLRTFGFVIAGLLILPKLYGILGIWLAIPVAEGIVFIISIIYLIYYKKQYGYM